VKRLPLFCFLLLPVIAACTGGGSSTSNALPRAMTAPQSSEIGASVLSEAQSDALQQTQPLLRRDAPDLLYVGNIGNNSITVYRHDAHGNTAPLRVIAGSNTGLNNPGQLSEDAQGNLYVANGSLFEPSTNPGILVFAHGVKGNVAPLRKLNPATGLIRIEAMTVDKKTGKLFVFEDAGDIRLPSLLRFPPKAAGNTAPFARASVTFPALQLASDSTGNNLIEAHFAILASDVGFGVETLVKQFYNNTSPTVLYDTSFFLAAGIADDPTTKTYLAMLDRSQNGGIYRLAENTVGNGPNPISGVTFAPRPISIITSETCGQQLALGSLRDIYVTHSKGGPPFSCTTDTDAVYVYAHDASGNVAPLRVLSGKATNLDEPYGIYVGQ
jgi:hypothetical protein